MFDLSLPIVGAAEGLPANAAPGATPASGFAPVLDGADAIDLLDVFHGLVDALAGDAQAQPSDDVQAEPSIDDPDVEGIAIDDLIPQLALELPIATQFHDVPNVQRRLRGEQSFSPPTATPESVAPASTSPHLDDPSAAAPSPVPTFYFVPPAQHDIPPRASASTQPVLHLADDETPSAAVAMTVPELVAGAGDEPAAAAMTRETPNRARASAPPLEIDDPALVAATLPDVVSASPLPPPPIAASLDVTAEPAPAIAPAAAPQAAPPIQSQTDPVTVPVSPLAAGTHDTPPATPRANALLAMAEPVRPNAQPSAEPDAPVRPQRPAVPHVVLLPAPSVAALTAPPASPPPMVTAEIELPAVPRANASPIAQAAVNPTGRTRPRSIEMSDAPREPERAAIAARPHLPAATPARPVSPRVLTLLPQGLPPVAQGLPLPAAPHAISIPVSEPPVPAASSVTAAPAHLPLVMSWTPAAAMAHTVAPAETSLAPDTPAPHNLDRIVQSIRLVWARGVGEAQIRLEPERFGELTISIRVEHGQVVARLQSDAPAVRDWLHGNQATLRQSLADHHLTLDRLEVVAPESPAEDAPAHDSRDHRGSGDAPPRRHRRPPPDHVFDIVA